METTTATTTTNNKRLRPAEAEEFPSSPPPEAKRILLDILDDDEDDSGDEDLADVMRSLEEEIALPPSPPPPPQAAAEAGDAAGTEAYLPDLGYLLEASDDELGLPPTEADAEVGVFEGAGEEIWGLEDEIRAAGCFGEHDDFGFRPVDGGEDDVGEVFDSGLFDFADEFSPVVGDTTWQLESMPAV